MSPSNSLGNCDAQYTLYADVKYLGKFSIANCPHGEIREIGEEALETAHDDSQMTEETDYDSSDIEIEKSINYRYPIIGAQVRPGSTKSKPRKFAINPPNNERRRPFQPCSHAGSCKSKQCSCYRAKVHCEKICGCSSTCSRRYRGCSCKTRGNAVCSNGDRSNCECIEISRECDADLCGSCGAADVLDPAHIYDDTVLGHRCNNVNLQRSVHKKTHVIDSKVHGFGLIAGEDFATGEFVGEYRGDIITKSEADRRGYVYHYEPTEYLFRLYEDPEDDDLEVAATKQELDGSRAGSKTRFINSAPEPRDKNANCSFKLLLCNTVLRVGVFATSDIQKGEEFLLDYGPSFFEPQSPAQARQPGPLDAVGMAMESAHEPNLVNEEEPVVTQELASIEEESLPPEETVSVDEQAPTKEPLPTEETGSLSEPAVVEEPLPSIEPNLIPPSSLRRSLSSASLGPISNEPIIPFSNVPRFKRLKIADSEYRRKATPDLLLVIPTELQQHVEPMSLSPVVPRISVSRGSARKSTGSTSASDGTRRPRTESTTTGSVAVSSIEESSASMESPPKRRIEGTDAALTLKRVKTAPTPILQNALKSPSAAGVNQQTKLGSSKTQADGQGTENLAGETPVEDLARQKLQSPIQKNGSKKTHSMPPRVSSPQTPIPVMGRSNTTPSLAQPSRFQRPESTESLTADLQKKISAARSPSAVARKSASTFPPPGTSMPASKASTHPVHDTASHNAPSGTPLNKSALTRGLSSTTTTSSASIPTTPSTKQNVNQSSTKAANSNKLGLWVARKSISSPAAQRPPGPSKAARKSSTPIVPQMIVISSDEERDAQGGAEGSKEKTPNDDDDNEETPDSDSDSDEDEGEDDGNDNNMDDDDNGEGGAGRGGGVGRTPSARLTQTHRPPDTETTL